MTYRLVIVTDGRGLLPATLASFAARVRPGPAEVDVRCDGPGALLEASLSRATEDLGTALWTLSGRGGERREGFCETTANAWLLASRPGPDYVFWLEDDFRFLRDVELGELARVLDGEPRLAQVALCRTAANDWERLKGGLVEARPGEYLSIPAPEPWLQHSSYFTTNPSLMRRDFMVEHPFPDDVSECEGRFGLDLVQQRYTFALMGRGEPWVDHVGVRAGTGY